MTNAADTPVTAAGRRRAAGSSPTARPAWTCRRAASPMRWASPMSRSTSRRRASTKIMAPWGPVARAERFGEPGSHFAPPWPEVAIATGRASIPYIRALKRTAGPATYTVVLQDPKTGPGTADLIWVPAHDRRRGSNVITTPTSPHSFSAARLAELRRDVPPAIAALPGPAHRRRPRRQEQRLQVHRRRRPAICGGAALARGARRELHDHAVAAHPSAA